MDMEKKLSALKVFFALAFCALPAVTQAIEQRRPNLFKDGESSICFVGDSITHHGYYPKQIALYYITRFPEYKIRFLNAGFEGGSANTTNIGFDIYVSPKNADVWTLMLGMNDVRHSNFSKKALADKQAHEKALAENFDRYCSNMKKLVRRLSQEGKLVLLSPSIYDGISDVIDPISVDRNAMIIPRKRAPGLSGVNDELKRYGEFVKKLSADNGALFADVWAQTQSANEAIVAQNPHSSAVGRNRVHPFDFGGFFAAAGFLKGVGESALVSEVDIDATSHKSSAKNARISDLKWLDGGVEFSLLENSLPFPLTKATFAAPRYCDFAEKLDMQKVKVGGLKKGIYSLQIDGDIVGFYSADDLSKGVNIALNPLTPQTRQAREVERQVEIWRKNTQRTRDLFGTEFIMRVTDYSDSAMDKNIESAKRYIAAKKPNKALRESFVYYINHRKDKSAFKKAAQEAIDRAYHAAKPRPHSYKISAADLRKLTPLKEYGARVIAEKEKYAPAPNCYFDAFAPENRKGKLPCAIIFHGGGWVGGNSADTQPLARFLSSNGYVCINAHYSMDYQQALRDEFTLFNYVVENAQRLGIDTSKIAVIGCSSGGVMASQIAAAANSDKAFKAFGLDESLKPKAAVGACITMGTGNDMHAPRRFNAMFACDVEKADKYGVYDKLSKSNPPTLILHGALDRVVTSGESLKMEKALKKIPVSARAVFYGTDKHHIWRFLEPAQDALEFLNTHLK